MPMKEVGRKTYKTLQGRQIDMDMLRQKNELTPAVGNVKVNARGDELGPGGKILRKREQVLKDYYDKQKSIPDEVVLKHEPEFVEAEQKATKKKTTKTEKAVDKNLTVTPEAPKEEWVEDEEGNYVKKEK